MIRPYRIGIIGLGSMGARYLAALQASASWDLVWVCNRSPEKLRALHTAAPTLRVTIDADELFNDPTLDVIGIFTPADVRPQLLRRALAAGKHVIAEKPLAASIAEEWDLLTTIEASDRLVAVNLFNRSAWYHDAIRQFIADGRIGSLAILRISHQTPGQLPSDGPSPEGPPFHNCGMHYVDLARWYAGGEYAAWHSQGLRMWDWPEPWWVTAHGNFTTGVVFEITVGFIYGHGAKDRTQHCAFEAIGTHGVVRMTHDFREVTIAYHGIDTTAQTVGAYGGKQLDVLCERFARSLDAGRNLGMPTARESVVASSIAQEMLDAASSATTPSVGTLADLQHLRAHHGRR